MSTETAKATDQRNLGAVLAALTALLGDRFSTGSSILDQHGRDESWHRPQRPDGVCFPETTEEISEICKICYANNLPIVAFGAGSSVEGALIPTSGGIVISTERMQALLNVDTANFDCTVQPGMKRIALNEALRDSGLFFPVDPGADASIGGRREQTRCDTERWPMPCVGSWLFCPMGASFALAPEPASQRRVMTSRTFLWGPKERWG